MIAANKGKSNINPIVILMGIVLLATFMTYFIDSGQYDRDGKLVVTGSYQPLTKDSSLCHLVEICTAQQEQQAKPVSLIGALKSIPLGLEKMAALIFMVLIIGGMFGVVTDSGAIDVGLEKMLSVAKGNLYLLIPVLMLAFSAGSSFLGLASEYLLIIPIVVAMANRMGLSNLVGFAIVAVAVKVGYLTSVTNPVALSIVQPLVGLPVFSGVGPRLGYYLVFLFFGILFVIWMVRREGYDSSIVVKFEERKMSGSHSRILLALGIGISFLVYASGRWQWHHQDLSAYYIGLTITIALAGGMAPSTAAVAFVNGMKKILLACFLIGVASAVAIVLQQGLILDTIAHALSQLIGDGNQIFAAWGMFVSQLLLDFLIPSTSGQAAISMPIMGPVGQLVGLQPQTTVTAFLFGNGITNIITPTSGTLLAYLATAEVSWTSWAKFILPLWFGFILLALLFLAISA